MGEQVGREMERLKGWDRQMENQEQESWQMSLLAQQVEKENLVSDHNP